MTRLPSMRWLLAAALVAVTACGGTSSNPGPLDTADPSTNPSTSPAVEPAPKATDPSDAAKSSATRNMSPSVPVADAQALVADNTAFGADLFKATRDSGNGMISPYSVSLALAMAYGGAKGQTATEMAQGLRFSLPPERLHPAFDQLDLALASRGQNAQGKDGKPFRLKVANAAWAQKDFSFVPAYLDLLATNYGAGINLVDYVHDSEGARQTINDWVAQATEDKIKDLLAPGTVDSLTRLVLTNAVYFNAAWATKFDPNETTNRPFTLTDGTQASVSTMQGLIYGSYADGADYLAAEFPYDGGETSMVVVMPKTGTLDTLVAGLDGAKLQAISKALAPTGMQVSMPSFKFQWKQGLIPALQALGMNIPFSDAADFSGISTAMDLHITGVIHQTFVAVDEGGTEAAAATAVVIGGNCVAQGTPFTVDRPFLFFIRDVQTGTVIFLGQVTDPR